jgi:Peptidase family M28
VLLEKLPTPERAVTAAATGATGMICMSAGRQRHKMIITPVWGTPGYDEAQAIPRVHVASISGDDGKRLIDWAKAGTMRATLITDTFEGWRRVRLPVAEIKGREPEFVLVGSHYCSWFDGSTDNVTGDSCILEMARLLKNHEGGLRYGARFAWWPGHSHARYSGSTWYADTYWQDLFDHAIAYFNIDSPGVKGATVYVPRHQMGEVAEFNESTTREITGWTTDTSSRAQLALGKRKDKYVSSTRPSRAADQSFWGVGLSSISVYGMLTPDDPNRDPNVGGSGGAWWWHSEHETVEKADMAILAQDVRLYVTLLSRLCTATILPFDFTESARDFLDALREYQEAAGQRLDFSGLKAKAQKLQDEVAALHKAAEGLNDEAETAVVNRLCLRLARWLNPVLYQSRSAYTHDAALSSRCLPGLGGALELAAMDPASDALRFDVAGLRREMNRIGHHLTEATRLVEGWHARAR